MSLDIFRAQLRLAHSFNRVGNAPRVGIDPVGWCSRGPLGTRLNEPMPTACGIARIRDRLQSEHMSAVCIVRTGFPVACVDNLQSGDAVGFGHRGKVERGIYELTNRDFADNRHLSKLNSRFLFESRTHTSESRLRIQRTTDGLSMRTPGSCLNSKLSRNKGDTTFRAVPNFRNMRADYS